jgi:hypothetical protein
VEHLLVDLALDGLDDSAAAARGRGVLEELELAVLGHHVVHHLAWAELASLRGLFSRGTCCIVVEDGLRGCDCVRVSLSS